MADDYLGRKMEEYMARKAIYHTPHNQLSAYKLAII